MILEAEIGFPDLLSWPTDILLALVSACVSLSGKQMRIMVPQKAKWA